MNTQAVGNRDAWAQFMKLTQEARMRNSGFVVRGERVSAPEREKTIPAAAVPSRGVSFSTAEPREKGRILGGLFDAYA